MSPVARVGMLLYLPRQARLRFNLRVTNFTRLASSSSRNPRERNTKAGISTPTPEGAVEKARASSPFYFDTGYALFAKRHSRPFPPPFLSPPSGSFSEPLSTHDRSRDRRPFVNGEMIRGITNGDDAVLVEENFIGANDGVGAWATKERGHAALWSRLILHFWALEAERAAPDLGSDEPDPIEYLDKAYIATQKATKQPPVHGTTTACAALLRHTGDGESAKPALYVTNLGDSQIMVLRPNSREVIYKTTEQWHWFDCPRQLGTNSPDTPRGNAVCDKLDVQENDVVIAMSDGVPDNLWEHEILENVLQNLEALDKESDNRTTTETAKDAGVGMMWVAEELVKSARTIAEDPFAESPFMERAVEEGLAIEGGKLDDISVVAAICKRRKG